jgi:hypothetical protein
LFWREQPVELSAFVQNEQVVIEGSSVAGAFVGTAMINVYRLVVESTITGRRGSTVSTDDREVQLIPATRYAHEGIVGPVPPQKIAVGEKMTALGRIDEPSADLVALRIY